MRILDSKIDIIYCIPGQPGLPGKNQSPDHGVAE